MIQQSRLSPGAEMQISEGDVMQLSEGQLDDYLDWYEKTWVDEERVRQKDRSLSEQLLKQFPIEQSRQTPTSRDNYSERTNLERDFTNQFVQDVVGSLEIPNRKFEHKAERSPGKERPRQNYQQYKSADELPHSARIFHEAVAEAAAIHLNTLLLGVLQMERRMVNRRNREAEREDVTDADYNLDDTSDSELADSDVDSSITTGSGVQEDVFSDVDDDVRTSR